VTTFLQPGWVWQGRGLTRSRIEYCAGSTPPSSSCLSRRDTIVGVRPLQVSPSRIGAKRFRKCYLWI